jgi:hypothetical protein
MHNKILAIGSLDYLMDIEDPVGQLLLAIEGDCGAHSGIKLIVLQIINVFAHLIPEVYRQVQCLRHHHGGSDGSHHGHHNGYQHRRRLERILPEHGGGYP